MYGGFLFFMIIYNVIVLHDGMCSEWMKTNKIISSANVNRATDEVKFIFELFCWFLVSGNYLLGNIFPDIITGYTIGRMISWDVNLFVTLIWSNPFPVSIPFWKPKASHWGSCAVSSTATASVDGYSYIDDWLQNKLFRNSNGIILTFFLDPLIYSWNSKTLHFNFPFFSSISLYRT